MRLDNVLVRPVLNVAAAAFHAEFQGCSVLVPSDESAQFEPGKAHRFSSRGSGEKYTVMVVAKHETTMGTCIVLKLWEPN